MSGSVVAVTVHRALEDGGSINVASHTLGSFPEVRELIGTCTVIELEGRTFDGVAGTIVVSVEKSEEW